MKTIIAFLLCFVLFSCTNHQEPTAAEFSNDAPETYIVNGDTIMVITGNVSDVSKFHGIGNFYWNATHDSCFHEFITSKKQ